MKFNVEDAFVSCGNNNKYQKIVLIAILFTWLSVDFVSLIFPLFELEPQYECKMSSGFVECDNALACSLPADKVRRLIEYRNILTDFGIDCSKVELILVGVTYTVGILIGSFVASIYSDIIGRKPVMIVSEIIFFCASALLISSPNYYFLLVALFLCGFSCSGGTIISYLYINEIIAKEKRSFYGIIINIFFAFGGLLYFSCFQFLKDWVQLTYICMGFDCISFVISYFYFVESPRYFYSCNRFSASLKALNTIAFKNNNQKQFDLFIKKSYVFFLQGKNTDLYFEDSVYNIKNATLDNSNSNHINGNSTFADLTNNTNSNTIAEANENNDNNDKTKNNWLEFNNNKTNQVKLFDELNVKEIFEFLEKYELEILEKQKNFEAEANIKNEDQIKDENANLANSESNNDNKQHNNFFAITSLYKSNEEKHEPFLDIENLNYKNSYNIKNEKQNNYKNNLLAKEENEDFKTQKTTDNLIYSDDASSSCSIAPENEILTNIKHFEKEKLFSLKISDYSKPVRKTSSYFSLIKYKSIRYQFLICNLVWFTYAFSYYGISFYLKKGKGEVFLDGYIIYTAEVISLIITFFIMSSSFFGRVRTISLMMIISGISTFCFYYMKNQNIEFYDKIPLFLSRFSITAINSTMYTYSTEFYPTIIRAKGLGINIFFARIACCLVPVLIEFLDNPFIIFSVLCCFTSFFTFFLPETLNKELEDEILEERGN